MRKPISQAIFSAAAGVHSPTERECAAALSQWVPYGAVDCGYGGLASVACLCGREFIRTAFILRNRVTGELLGPVGSSCVNDFPDEGPTTVKRLTELAKLAVLSRSLGGAGRLPTCRLERLVMGRFEGDVTMDAFRGLYDMGFLSPVSGDSHPEADEDEAPGTLSDGFHKYKTGRAARERASDLLEQRARPRLDAWYERNLTALDALLAGCPGR